jgi:phage replication O-like protein O
MKSPQKENGYTPIANEILEQVIQLSLNGTQLRIIMFVWRYTYGYSRKEHDLSEGFIVKETGINRRQVQRALSELIKMNIIQVLQDATFNATRIIGFNKDYDSWQAANMTPGGELTATPQEEKNDKNEDEFSHDKDFEGVAANTPPGDNLTAHIKQDLKTKDLVADTITPLPPKNDSPLDSVEGLVPELFGRMIATPREIESMERLINITGGDIDFIMAVVRKAYQNFKPQYEGNKIKSFVYFEDIVKQEWANQQARNGTINSQKVVDINAGKNRGNFKTRGRPEPEYPAGGIG